MKLVLLPLTVACAAAVAFCDGGEASDARVKEMIIRSGTYIHGGERAARALMAAKEHCGSDTNRFANLLCDISQTNDMYIARRMVRLLGHYGTREQLPHLYSLVANTNLCCDALSAVMRIGGVSSNSLSATASVLSNLHVRELDRLDLCVALVDNAYSLRTSTAQRDMALSFLWAHFRTCPYPQGIDEALVRKDAGYRHSRRRLANLRAVYAHGVDQWDIAYVTNAINELVAYPEQNLSE